MPSLKDHLQQEWDTLATREKARQERKQKLEAKKSNMDETQ
jgi:aprataxin